MQCECEQDKHFQIENSTGCELPAVSIIKLCGQTQHLCATCRDDAYEVAKLNRWPIETIIFESTL